MERALTAATLIAAAVAWAPAEARAVQEPPPEPEPPPPVAVAPAPPIAPLQAARGGYLGVRIEDVDAVDAERLGLPGVRGALVAGVVESSPAEQAGIRDGDVILGWDGREVRSVAQLRRLVRETPPGREVAVTVFRDGSRRELAATVGERRRPFAAVLDSEEWEERMERMRERLGRVHRRLEGDSAEREERLEELGRLGERLERMEVHPHVEVLPHEGAVVRLRASGGAGRLGVRVQRITDQLARYFGVREDVGVLVASVEEDSPAGRAGLRAGDVVVAIGDEEIDSPGALRRALRDAEAGPVDVTLVREGTERSLTVELPERP